VTPSMARPLMFKQLVCLQSLGVHSTKGGQQMPALLAECKARFHENHAAGSRLGIHDHTDAQFVSPVV
jgi:hypothetical protein